SYSYTPAHEKFKDQIKVVHFIGSNKPWNSQLSSEYYNCWWQVHDKFVVPRNRFYQKLYNSRISPLYNEKEEITICDYPQELENFTNYRVKWSKEVEDSISDWIKAKKKREVNQTESSEDTDSGIILNRSFDSLNLK